MPGFQAPQGGVIPPDISITTLKPDLFLVNASLSVIVFFELTCPWDDNIHRSHEFKDRKYAPLIADLSRNFRVHNYSVEISVRGQVSKQNRARLKSFLFNCCSLPRNSVKRLIRICSKASLLSSYSIFGARKEPSWMSPNPLVVRDWLLLPLPPSILCVLYCDSIFGFTIYGVTTTMTLYWPCGIIMVQVTH